MYVVYFYKPAWDSIAKSVIIKDKNQQRCYQFSRSLNRFNFTYIKKDFYKIDIADYDLKCSRPLLHILHNIQQKQPAPNSCVVKILLFNVSKIWVFYWCCHFNAFLITVESNCTTVSVFLLEQHFRTPFS